MSDEITLIRDELQKLLNRLNTLIEDQDEFDSWGSPVDSWGL